MWEVVVWKSVYARLASLIKQELKQQLARNNKISWFWKY